MLQLLHKTNKTPVIRIKQAKISQPVTIQLTVQLDRNIVMVFNNKQRSHRETSPQVIFQRKIRYRTYHLHKKLKSKSLNQILNFSARELKIVMK